MEVWAAAEILGGQDSIRMRLEAESVSKKQLSLLSTLELLGAWAAKSRKRGYFLGC